MDKDQYDAAGRDTEYASNDFASDLAWYNEQEDTIDDDQTYQDHSRN